MPEGGTRLILEAAVGELALGSGDDHSLCSGGQKNASWDRAQKVKGRNIWGGGTWALCQMLQGVVSRRTDVNLEFKARKVPILYLGQTCRVRVVHSQCQRRVPLSFACEMTASPLTHRPFITSLRLGPKGALDLIL